jgi:alanine racemase
MKGERPTTASVDLAALSHNYAEAERLAGGRQVIAVVKADAYGHGAVPVARRLVAAGAKRLAVATVAEAAELRAAAVRVPILVLGGVHDAAEADDAAALDLVPAIQHGGHVPLLARAARERGARLAVELEVDTGMARMGVAPEDVAALSAAIAREASLALEGVYTHLACADEADLGPTRRQLALFGEVLAGLRARALAPARVHVANSAGLVAGAELGDALPPEVNAVRPGLLLYGVQPSATRAPAAALRPVMSLRTRVSNVRHVRRGDPVGYGATFRAKQRGRVATLPIGYADGIPWSLGNRGHVLLRGRKVRIAGRVSMDLVTLDVGEGPVEIGDPVVVFGQGAGADAARLPVEEQAEAAGTIPYELLVRVSRRVPRVLEDEG